MTYVNGEIHETYTPNGIVAHGVGIMIYPVKQNRPPGRSRYPDDWYVVRTRMPGGSPHGTRYYVVPTYEAALKRATRWHTQTMPRRLAGRE